MSEAFFYRIAHDVEQAAAENRLETRFVPPYSFDPCFSNYAAELPASFQAVWSVCWTGVLSIYNYKELAGDHVRNFDLIACRRARSDTSPARSYVRDWMATQYTRYMQYFLLVSVIVATVVSFLRWRHSRCGMYCLIGTILAVAGLSRLALFALIDASSFPGIGQQYVFPGALTLTLMATWFVAGGMPLLFCASNATLARSVSEGS
jgi:hypothetical protein